MASWPMARKGASLSVVHGLNERSYFAGRRRWTPFPDALIRSCVDASSVLYRRDLRAHYGCVNAIEFSSGDGRLIASGGDDRRVLVWDVERALSDAGSPAVMQGEHLSNIFCVAFSSSNTKLFSGGNDEQVLVHEVESGRTLNLYMHEDAVYGLAVDPVNDDVFASACDDGNVHIYDLRARPTEGAFELASCTSPMHAVVYNPAEPRLIATANAREGVGLWDIRRPKTCLLRYGTVSADESCMSVRFSYIGDRLLALRRRLPPVLYRLDSTSCHVQFNHAGYHNSCTMKSCSFAGSHDQYILSGSDDFNLYMWKIPDEPIEGTARVSHAHMVLRGHRSIVNQVRYNKASALIISSGVEKIIKVWSPFELPGSEGSNVLGRSACGGEDGGRMRHIDYLEMILRNGHAMSHDYSHQSTDEDPHMIAFFDSLVRRERDGWTSGEDDDSLSRDDDDIEDQALDYHHTEQSSSDDDEETDGNLPHPWPGVVFRPLRYPQARDAAATSSVVSTSTVQQNTADNSQGGENQASCVRHRRRRRFRRMMLRRVNEVIPITSFISSHSPTDDGSSSESTTSSVVDSTSDDSGNDESDESSSSTPLSEAFRTADPSPSGEPSAVPDLCCETVDSLTLRRSRESLSRLKHLRKHDSGEFFLSSLSPSSSAKCLAASNSLPPPTGSGTSFCDGALDDCISPVKLNGKSQPCSESANGATELHRFTDFMWNTVETAQEAASVNDGGDDPMRPSSAVSVEQELCSILNQVSNGDATGADFLPADRFHSRLPQTKSGSRRYRRTFTDADADRSSDED